MSCSWALMETHVLISSGLVIGSIWIMLGLEIQFWKATLRSENVAQFYMDSNSHCSHIFCFVFFCRSFHNSTSSMRPIPFGLLLHKMFSTLSLNLFLTLPSPLSPRLLKKPKCGGKYMKITKCWCYAKGYIRRKFLE